MGKRGLFSSWAILLSDPRLLSVNRACIANCSNVRRLEGLSKQTAQVPLVLSSGVCWRSGYDHTEAVLHIRLRARTMRNGFGPVIFKSSEFLPIHRRGVGRPHPRNFASNNSTASTKANGVNMGARAPSLFSSSHRWIAGYSSALKGPPLDQHRHHLARLHSRPLVPSVNLDRCACHAGLESFRSAHWSLRCAPHRSVPPLTLSFR